MSIAGLKAAAKEKSDRCFSRALQAIDELKRSEEKISFASVMEKAKVSRAYLYNNTYLRDLIISSRDQPGRQDSTAALKVILDSQKVEIQRLTRMANKIEQYEKQIKRLREENRQLKEQLKSLYSY